MEEWFRVRARAREYSSSSLFFFAVGLFLSCFFFFFWSYSGPKLTSLIPALNKPIIFVTDGVPYDLHERSDILLMPLICVESEKIPLLRKMKQLFKRLPVGGFNRHCTSCTPRWRVYFQYTDCDRVMKRLLLAVARQATCRVGVSIMDTVIR